MPFQGKITTATPSAIYGTLKRKNGRESRFGEILSTVLLLVLALFLYQGYERGREGNFPARALNAGIVDR